MRQIIFNNLPHTMKERYIMPVIARNISPATVDVDHLSLELQDTVQQVAFWNWLKCEGYTKEKVPLGALTKDNLKLKQIMACFTYPDTTSFNPIADGDVIQFQIQIYRANRIDWAPYSSPVLTSQDLLFLTTLSINDDRTFNFGDIVIGAVIYKNIEDNYLGHKNIIFGALFE